MVRQVETCCLTRVQTSFRTVTETFDSIDVTNTNANSGNTYSNGNNKPPLLYRDQTAITPISKPPKKKPVCAAQETDDISHKIQAAVEQLMQKIVPQIIESLEKKIIASVEQAVNYAVAGIKEKLMINVMSQQKNNCYLKTLSEKLESYNRRDNIRILGLLMNETRENYDETIDTVFDMSEKIGANVTVHNISIAHKLPTRNKNTREKPVIVRFNRRIAKVKILRSKKKLPENEHTSTIKIIEDVRLPRIKFMQLIRNDQRIQSSWNKEGAIFVEWKSGQGVDRINGLYEGGGFLGYSCDDMMICFKTEFFSKSILHQKLTQQFTKSFVSSNLKIANSSNTIDASVLHLNVKSQQTL